MKFRWDPNLTYEEKLRIHNRLMAEGGEYAVRAGPFTEEEKIKLRERKARERLTRSVIKRELGSLFRSGD